MWWWGIGGTNDWPSSTQNSTLWYNFVTNPYSRNCEQILCTIMKNSFIYIARGIKILGVINEREYVVLKCTMICFRPAFRQDESEARFRPGNPRSKTYSFSFLPAGQSTGPIACIFSAFAPNFEDEVFGGTNSFLGTGTKFLIAVTFLVGRIIQ